MPRAPNASVPVESNEPAAAAATATAASATNDNTQKYDTQHTNGIESTTTHTVCVSPPFASCSSVPTMSPIRLRTVASILSGEEADSEPSSGGSSIAGSTASLTRMNGHGGVCVDGNVSGGVAPSSSLCDSRGWFDNNGGSASASEEESAADREVRMVIAAAGRDQNGETSTYRESNRSSGGSSLNLLLSTHLSQQFTPNSAAASSRPSSSKPALWRRLFHPYQPFSNTGVFWYTVGSAAMWYWCRCASYRSQVNRTMISYIPPFLLREAPQLFAGLTTLGLIRTVYQLRTELNPMLLISWFTNLATVMGLIRLTHRMARSAPGPFRRALAAKNIGVPEASSHHQEDVLTIVPMQRIEQEPLPRINQDDGLEKSAFAQVTDDIDQQTDVSTFLSSSSSSSSSPSPSSATTTTLVTSTSAPSSLPTSTTDKAYRRIGRMTPLRWFLSTSQLTKTLAWVEEVQWRTGVVYDRIESKQKTHTLKLDVYRPKVSQTGQLLPVFLYIHGGGWVTGHRSFHSLAMLYAIAKSGFMVASINYRLYPWLHPTHLIDCKRSLAWLRSNAASFGGDANFVVVGGESAGAHLACLVGLTPNVMHLQPGFENVDTTVQGVVDLYGCHDLADSNYHFRCREDPNFIFGGFHNFLHRFVIGVKSTDAKYAYEMASPLFRLAWTPSSQTIPPFFGSHGTHDDIIPIEDSIEFYEKLKEKRAAEVANYQEQYAVWESRCAAIRARDTNAVLPHPPLPLLPDLDVFVKVPYASHAYNNLMSPRGFALNDTVTVWLASLLKAHRTRDDECSRLQLLSGSSAGPILPPDLSRLPVEPMQRAIQFERKQVQAILEAERAEAKAEGEVTNCSTQTTLENTTITPDLTTNLTSNARFTLTPKL